MNSKRTRFHRFLEIFPGVLTWTTLLGAPILAYFHPAWMAIYIILFDTYWFLKGANVAIHLLHSYKMLETHSKIDWLDWSKRVGDLEGFKKYLGQMISQENNRALRNVYSETLFRLSKIKENANTDWIRIYHLILLPTMKEDISVLESSVRSYAEAGYPADKIIFVLAMEERAGDIALENMRMLEQKFGSSFGKYMAVLHPDGLEGETKGKGANITYAAKEAVKFLDTMGIPHEDVLVSAFDSDTTIHPNYFAHLTFDFLTVDKPHQMSYQPMPVYHNNIWDTPAIARVIATSSSFWQLVEASRPDRLITFSSHSMSLKTLIEVGYWRVDIIPEDSHIFWQCFLHFDGDYRTQPLFTTVSMDAVLGESYFGTLIAQYKQKRRWAWGVTEISMTLPEIIKNKNIPLWKKFIYPERLIEGHYFWATASIMIAILGWLPLIFGGDRFGDTVLAMNLPYLTRIIMTTAMIFLIFSMYVNIVMLPPRPKGYSRWKSISMVLQWLLSPIVSSVFGSAPAIDAQTRLMFGKYMEFWVTPKIRKNMVTTQEVKIPAKQ